MGVWMCVWVGVHAFVCMCIKERMCGEKPFPVNLIVYI